MTRTMIAAAAIVMMLIVNCARAENGQDSDCSGLQSVLPPDQLPEISVGTIVGNGPSYFLVQPKSSCNARPKNCREPQQAYLVAGDKVVLTKALPGYFCVEYTKQTQKQLYAGWMPIDRIKVDPSSTTPLSSWAGTWHDGSTIIRLRTKRKRLIVYGDMVFINKAGVPNYGELNDSAFPRGNRLSIGDGESPCQVKMLLADGMLFVVDNGGCGGSGVQFTGKYLRKSK